MQKQNVLIRDKIYIYDRLQVRLYYKKKENSTELHKISCFIKISANFEVATNKNRKTTKKFVLAKYISRSIVPRDSGPSALGRI